MKKIDKFSLLTLPLPLQVRMHREMGLNLIRVWGGGLTERPEFYTACDEQGVLVMQEFWMGGDNNGRWAGSFDWPANHTSYHPAPFSKWRQKSWFEMFFTPQYPQKTRRWMYNTS